MAGLVTPHSSEEHGQSLINYLPGGPIFEAANIDGTKLRTLLLALGVQLAREEAKINEIACEHFINETSLLIDEWESAVAIPDDCFPGTGDIETRRQHVLIKLASLNVSTLEDFEAVADLFGFDIKIQSGAECGTFPLTMPACLFDDAKEARFTMIVTIDDPNFAVFPFTATGGFPITLNENLSNIITCLFNKLKPANVNIIYKTEDL